MSWIYSNLTFHWRMPSSVLYIVYAVVYAEPLQIFLPSPGNFDFIYSITLTFGYFNVLTAHMTKSGLRIAQIS